MIRSRTAVVALVTICVAVAAACGFDGAGAIDGDLLDGGDRLPDGALRDPASGDATVDPADAAGSADGGADATDDAPFIDPADAADAADGFVAPTTCAAVCPGAGGTCVGGVCQIDCTTAAPCNALVVCPAGVPCKVTCAKNGCQTGIDCTKATSCDLSCGEQACGNVACAGSTCTVLCDGNGNASCRGTVVCHATGSCAITCSGGGKTCQGKVTCAGGSCAVNCLPNQNASCSPGQCCTAGSCTATPTNTCP